MRKTFAAVTVSAISLMSWAGVAQAELLVATTLQNTLITFDSATPGTLISGFAIQGLANNETLRGIDIRPANNTIYGVGSFGNLYTLNISNGVATPIGTITGAFLNGSNFGVDFNPVADRLRVVSNVDQNLRINIATGAALVDVPLNYAVGDTNFGVNPNEVFVAYTNAFAGAGTTTLYGIDAGTATLVIQNPPNNGTLNTVGSLFSDGGDINELGGFDISGASGVAYASFIRTDNFQSVLYTINLSTGLSTPVGQIGGGALVTGLTIASIPEPTALSLVGVAGLMALRRRR